MTNTYISTSRGDVLIEDMSDEDVDEYISYRNYKDKCWLVRELVMQLKDSESLCEEMKKLGRRC